MSWQLYRTFAVRVTGFSFALTEDLRPTGLVARLRAVGRADQALGELREELLREAFPAAVRTAATPAERRVLSRLRSAVGRARPLPAGPDTGTGRLAEALSAYGSAIADREAAEAAVAGGWPADAAALRQVLHGLASRPDVQEAIMRLSPSFGGRLTAWSAGPLPAKENSAERALQRRLALYVQRLAAKNETNSFFGPVGWGGVDDRTARVIEVAGTVSAGPPQVFASHRLATGLAAALAAETAVRPYLAPRRSTLLRLVGDQVILPGSAARLTEIEQAVLRAADGTVTLAAVAGGAGAPVDTVVEVAARLAARGWLVLGPVVDPESADPLASLERALRRLPAASPVAGHWAGHVASVRRRLRELETSRGPARHAVLRTLEREWESVTGQQAARGEGEMYADRTLVFEERPYTGSLRLGAELATAIAEHAGPVLSLWAAVGQERRRRARRETELLLHRHWPGAREVPFLAYLGAAAADRTRGGAEEPASERTSPETAVAELIGSPAPPVVELTPGQLAAVTPPVELPALASVDVLVGAADTAALQRGEYSLVLGEAHAPNLLSVFPTDHFLRLGRPQEAALRDEWLARLAGDGHRLGYIVTARRTKIFAYPAPAVPIELRPLRPSAGAVPAADLVIRLTSDGLRLCDADGPLLLFPPLHRASGFDPLLAFSLPMVETNPFGDGDVLPRVTVGPLVVQRRQRRTVLPATVAAATGAARLLAAWRWGRSLGLGERVYVRISGEPKPVFVDFASPHLVDALVGLARDERPLTVAEMLPGPADLWLGGPDGPHTCELRLLMAVPSAGNGGTAPHR